MDDFIEIEEKPQNENQIYTYEEAIELLGNGKFHYILLLVSIMCVMSMTSEFLNAGVLISLSQCDLHLTMTEKGFLTSAGFFGIITTLYIWGFLTDTWGRRNVLHFASIAASIFSIISAFSVSPLMLCIFRFLVGASISGCQASIFTFMSEFHGQKTRVKYSTLLLIFLGIPFITIPVIGLGCSFFTFNYSLGGIEFKSWRLFIIIVSTPTFLSAILLYKIPESPKYLLAQGQNEKALKILNFCYNWNHNQKTKRYPVKFISLCSSGSNIKNITGIKSALVMVYTQTAPLFNKTFVWKSLNLLLHQFIIYFVSLPLIIWYPYLIKIMIKHENDHMTICEAVKYESYPLIATNRFTDQANGNFCPITVNIFGYIILTIIGIVFVLVNITFFLLVSKVETKLILIITLIVCGFCGLTTLWINQFYINNILITLFIAIGNSGGLIGIISIEFYPTNINAMASGVIWMIGRLGSALGNYIIGKIIQNDCQLLFISYISAVFFCATLTYFLPGKFFKSSKSKTNNEL